MAKRHSRFNDETALQKKGVRFENGFIKIPKNTLGIKSWGKVDYLIHNCGYYGYVFMK